jgi:REP element-mobilizing transposase RayT
MKLVNPASSLHAYVIMPDHLHVITDSTLTPSATLRFINGITGRRIIDYLKENDHESSLRKLRHETRPRRCSYSLWDHHPDARLLLTENMLMQRVNYIHQNPVRAGSVNRPEDYRWSSVRCWSSKIFEDEPLLMNIDRIKWRSGGGASYVFEKHSTVSGRLAAMLRQSRNSVNAGGTDSLLTAHCSLIRWY